MMPWVYPRWRGEHLVDNPTDPGLAGLSPLARGTPQWLPLNHRASRFIPAGAGNTVHPRGGRQKTPVYPRWRGEHFLGAPVHRVDAGLSPLARGTHNEKKYHP
ncbi:hypothetical protein FORC88_930 [Salmonella enterica subsp. enterica serovar Typhimurium]|nr:hypothetical protein FORC88_930 [Salmonella enterica subsp. enterica serovar Typhimurium]